MSYSAWLHEDDHYEYDKEKGFPGFTYYLLNQSIWDDMEKSAYGKELTIAVECGIKELVDALQSLLDEELRRRS